MNEKVVGTRRSRFKIVAEILRQSQTPAKKTHIMYECNLSFKQLKYYLRFMILKGLIRRKKKSETLVYQMTENGQTFLDVYSRIIQLLQV